VQNIKTNILIITGLLWLSGCSFFQKDNERSVVAQVYDKPLYLDEIPKEVYQNKNPEDSLNSLHQYIENWAYQTLLIKEAERNVDTLKINRLVQKYKEDLLSETYKNLLLQKYIDTLVPQDTLQAYYQKYSGYFKAKENMILPKYLVTAKNNPKNNTLKKWFFSDQPDLQDSLIKNSNLLQQIDLTGKKWMNIEEFKEQFPAFKKINERYILKKSKKFVITDSLSLYLVFVKDIVLENEDLPLDFIQNDLKQLIFSKRKQQAVKKLEREIKQEAIKRKHFKIFKTKIKDEQ